MNILLSLTLLLGTLLRLISLNQSLWLDEAAQATISRQGIFHINFIADFQPPLFYIITHFWQKIGIHSEWFLRLPSVLSGVVTIYILYLIVKKLAGDKSALLASLLLAVNPYHIYYSQEYRMYSFFAFLTTLSWYFLLEKKWKSYTLTLIALLYTHYFAGLVIIGQLVFFYITKKNTLEAGGADGGPPKTASSVSDAIFGGRQQQAPLRKCILFSSLFFIPWLPTLYKQLQTSKALISAWPTWSSIAGVAFWKFPLLLLAKFTVGMISPPKIWYGLAFLTMLFFAIYGVYHLYKNRSQTMSKLIFCWLFIPAGIAWIASIWIHANAPHRFVFLIPAFCTLLINSATSSAGGVRGGPPKTASSVSDAIFGGGEQQAPRIFIFSTFTLFLFSSCMYLFNPHYHREDWKGAIAYVDTHLQKNDLALTEFSGPWAPMDWYSKKPSHYIGASNSLIINQKTIGEELNDIRNCKLEIRNCSFYLFSYLFELSDPNREVEHYLLRNDYKLTEEKDFRGVGIVRKYSKN